MRHMRQHASPLCRSWFIVESATPYNLNIQPSAHVILKLCSNHFRIRKSTTLTANLPLSKSPAPPQIENWSDNFRSAILWSKGRQRTMRREIIKTEWSRPKKKSIKSNETLFRIRSTSAAARYAQLTAEYTMGNNTSVPSNIRKKSISREYNKPHSSHEEYIKTRDVQQKTTDARTELSSGSENVRPGANRTKSNNSVFSIDHENFANDEVDIDRGEISQYNSNDNDNDILYDDFQDNDNIDDDLLGYSRVTQRPDSNKEENVKQAVLIKYYDHHLTAHDSVYIIGSFNDWRERIRLRYENDSISSFFSLEMRLPLGIYRVKFIVNDDVKYADNLPIATDKSGNVVNWFEVDSYAQILEAGAIERSQIHKKTASSSTFFNNGNSSKSRPSSTTSQQSLTHAKHYSTKIPSMFEPREELIPDDENLLTLHPIPELPVYLNNNYLNKHFNIHHHHSLEHDTAKLTKPNNKLTTEVGLNSHIIPHVNLNHLLTSNIKNNVLSVAMTTRYSGKFITQIMYSPSNDS